MLGNGRWWCLLWHDLIPHPVPLILYSHPVLTPSITHHLLPLPLSRVDEGKGKHAGCIPDLPWQNFLSLKLRAMNTAELRWVGQEYPDCGRAGRVLGGTSHLFHLFPSAHIPADIPRGSLHPGASAWQGGEFCASLTLPSLSFCYIQSLSEHLCLSLSVNIIAPFLSCL